MEGEVLRGHRGGAQLGQVGKGGPPRQTDREREIQREKGEQWG